MVQSRNQHNKKKKIHKAVSSLKSFRIDPMEFTNLVSFLFSN